MSTTLINDLAIETLILETLKEDMNTTLNIVTAKVVKEIESTVKRNVAARMIGMISSEYSVEYVRNELRVHIKLESNL